MLTSRESNELLSELHDGVCGGHVGGAFVSIQSNESRILMAADAEGCNGICPEM